MKVSKQAKVKIFKKKKPGNNIDAIINKLTESYKQVSLYYK